MVQDTKRLKASLDLAQLQHQSYGTKDTLAALEAAEEAYDLALEAELVEADFHFDEDDDEQHTDADIEAARKLLAKVDKKSTTTTGTRRRPVAIATDQVVAPNHATAAPGKTAAQVEIVNSTGILGNVETGAEQGQVSDATKAAQELVGEKKS